MERAADTLGLRAPAYEHLRDSLEAGEFPLWLRIGDPVLAGLFNDPFAFEILCEKARLRAGFERRLENVRRAAEKAGRDDLQEALDAAADEGDLEDIGFALQGEEGAESEAAADDAAEAAGGADEYLAALRKDHQLASQLRASFREHCVLSVAATEKEGVERAPYQSLIGWNSPLATVPPAKYLQIRRGERAHALTVSFDWSASELSKLAEERGGFPPQERDKFVQAFVTFAKEERMSRLVQEARAQLKRTAETEALRNAWEQIDFAINRGRHQGPVIGLCGSRGGKVQAALIDGKGEFVRAVSLAPKSDALEADLRELLGDVRPELVAYQGDTASRNLAQRLVKMIPGLDSAPAPAPEPEAPTAPEAPASAAAPEGSEATEGAEAPTAEAAAEAAPPAEATPPAEEAAAEAPAEAKPQKKGKGKKAEKSRVRQAHVPVSVARTLQREVARRGAETLLSHDERTSYLVARFAWDPRGTALATPHVLRAFISFRGEVNPRRMEEFEVTFLRALLAEKGVDANSAPLEVLRMVPGVDAEGIVIERSTAPFLSLDDLIDRLGMNERDARAALCLLRVRGGDEPLDARPLHPVYYPILRGLAEQAGVKLGELLRDPNRVNDLAWDELLAEHGWYKSVIGRVRQGLERGGNRRRRPAGPGGAGPRQGGGRPRRGGKGLDSLEVGSVSKGKVTAVTDYGAFIDIGARTEGLVHISEMSDEFVEDPNTVLTVGQEVEARIVSVDLEKQRFRLSLRSEDGPRGGKRGEEESQAPGFVRSTRPKSAGGGGRGGGGGRDGGGRGRGGGRGGRSGGRDDRRGKREDYGKDPKAGKKEEIDPTNPFYQFFKDQAKD